MGTPAYMSPEQAKGMPADERSDLFSLGIIAYQMLTGVVPYKAERRWPACCCGPRDLRPRPSEIEPTLPQPLNDLVLKTLATNPPDRYQSASLLNQDLHDWQEGVLARAIVTPPMTMMAESKAKKWISLAVGWRGGIDGGSLRRGPLAEQTARSRGADDRGHRGFQQPYRRSGLQRHPGIHAEVGHGRRHLHQRLRPHEDAGPGLAGDLRNVRRVGGPGGRRQPGLNVVVSGSLDRSGAAYQLSLRAIQAVTGKVITSAEETAATKDQVLFAVTKLAADCPEGLGRLRFRIRAAFLDGDAFGRLPGGRSRIRGGAGRLVQRQE